MRNLECKSYREDELLVMECTGEYTYADLKVDLEESLENCISLKLKGLLVDLTHVKGDIHIMDRYGLIKSLEKVGVSKLTICLVHRTDQKHLREFGNTVVENRGVRLRNFDKADKAIKWLKANYVSRK